MVTTYFRRTKAVTEWQSVGQISRCRDGAADTASGVLFVANSIFSHHSDLQSGAMRYNTATTVNIELETLLIAPTERCS